MKWVFFVFALVLIPQNAFADCSICSGGTYSDGDKLYTDSDCTYPAPNWPCTPAAACPVSKCRDCNYWKTDVTGDFICSNAASCEGSCVTLGQLSHVWIWVLLIAFGIFIFLYYRERRRRIRRMNRSYR